MRTDSAGGLERPARLPDGKQTQDPVEAARLYASDGADALMLAGPDTSPGELASICGGLAEAVSLPVVVAADFPDLAALEPILVAGARRIVLRDSALDNPDLIIDVVRQLDPEAVALEIRARRADGHWRVTTGDGGETEWDPVTWARVAEAQGASELIVEPAATQGLYGPYDLDLLASIVQEVSIPVLASGRAAGREDVLDALMLGRAAGVLLDDLLSSGEIRIPALRAYLGEHGL